MKSVFIRPPDPPAPWRAYSTRPSWVKPRLPPSPMHLARRSSPLTRIASLALSPASALVSSDDLT